ncbi:MAG TPA: amidohydrolase [Candidatus Limnocylindrales bacterium]|nr:amidohydrolase [Candidatus Limnocylindrales bacterium]
MPHPEDAAELVLTGGHVHTVDAARPRADAVAVRGERIVAVGSIADVAPWIGPRTRVIDLAGRLLLPGFQDAHIHPISSGVESLRCDVSEVHPRAAVFEKIRAYADAHPELDWIVGSGWYMGDFPRGVPHRADLDAVVADRPAFLPNRDGHTAWVNSRALELAGIDRDTPDPSGGRIERDPDGTPSGCLHETAAEIVERLLPPTTVDDRAEGLRIAQAYLHSLGITAWQDAIVEPGSLAAYRRASAEGWLTARVEAALWWERDEGPEQIEKFIDASRAVASEPGRLRANSVKLMMDGVLETFTGSMLDPYLGPDGRPTTNRGIDFMDPESLGGYVARIDAAGLQPHFHALGDRGVRNALDAVEVARRTNGPSDTRPHLAHIQVIHPDDIPRFAALDAVANAQPLWASHDPTMDELTIPFLGPERAGWQYPFGSLVRAGARLAMGSDWAVSTANPLEEIEVAVTRVYPGFRGQAAPFLPDEALTLAVSIAAFTLGSAWVNHLDVDTGSIEVGKLADLTVIDRDLFAADAGPIADGHVLATFVGGAAVFEDAALG